MLIQLAADQVREYAIPCRDEIRGDPAHDISRAVAVLAAPAVTYTTLRAAGSAL